jgi:hypothetical protein
MCACDIHFYVEYTNKESVESNGYVTRVVFWFYN